MDLRVISMWFVINISEILRYYEDPQYDILIECGYVRHGLLRPLSKFGWCSDPVAKLRNLLSSSHLNVKITGLKEIFTARDLTNHGGFSRISPSFHTRRYHLDRCHLLCIPGHRRHPGLRDLVLFQIYI